MRSIGGGHDDFKAINKLWKLIYLNYYIKIIVMRVIKNFFLWERNILSNYCNFIDFFSFIFETRVQSLDYLILLFILNVTSKFTNGFEFFHSTIILNIYVGIFHAIFYLTKTRKLFSFSALYFYLTNGDKRVLFFLAQPKFDECGKTGTYF